MAEKLKFILEAKDKFSSTLGTATKGFAALTAAYTATVGAVFLLTKSTANAYDEMGKFSQRIGISVEALSSYNHVAELSGISVEKFRNGLQLMQRNLAEAATGTGPAADAMATLGLNINTIQAMNPDQKFEAIADALNNLDDSSQKVGIAMDLMGRSGAEMLQAMVNGSEGIREMREEAEKFGLVISGQAAGNAAAFNDSLTRLGGAFTGVKNKIAEDLMPVMTGFFNSLANVIADNREAIVGWARQGMSMLADFVEYGAYGAALLVDAFRGLEMIWEVLKIGFAEFSIFVNKGLEAISEGLTSFMQATNIGGVFDDAILTAQAFTGMAKDSIVEMTALSASASANLKALSDEAMATEKVDEYVAAVKNGMAELASAGTGTAITSGMGGGDETTSRAAIAAQDIEAMKAMYDEYYLTESERLTEWYEAEQEKYAGHQEQLAQLDWVYAAKRMELEKKEKAASDKKEKERLANRQKAMSDFYSNIQVIGDKYGKSAFEASKAVAISQTVMDTYRGAQAAFTSLAQLGPFGVALGIAAAAAAIAAGLSRVNKIRSTTYGQAHAGMTSIPEDATYALRAGERVIQPEQNRDLTSFLAGNTGGGAGNNISLNLEVLPNATNVEAMLSMSSDDWMNIVEEKIYPAINRLRTAGVEA